MGQLICTFKFNPKLHTTSDLNRLKKNNNTKNQITSVLKVEITSETIGVNPVVLI